MRRKRECLAYSARFCHPIGMTGLRELLLFYRDAGVDAALTDMPVNHFEPVAGEASSERGPAERERLRPGPAPALPAKNAIKAAVPDDGQTQAARELAAGAETLEELRQRMERFEGCNLRFTATRLVFGDGNPAARLMVIGEAPGREEDLEGLPFVGRSGRLLDRMLAAIGHDRSSLYITNGIPWRPPGNRPPTAQEAEICRPFIERQIELIRPELLLILGGSASKLLLGTTESIMRLRGSWRHYERPPGLSIPVMPTLHPAYLLRNPAHKRLVWRDLLEVKVRLLQSERESRKSPQDS